MYHAFVRRQVRNVFETLNRGEYEPLMRQFAPNHEHIFPGEHALGGSRHSAEAMREWFQRLFKVFPGLQLEVKHIAVHGWPWDTVAAVEWVDRAPPVEGRSYINHGVHVIRLQRGRAVSTHAYLDTQVVEAWCKWMAQHGIAEAVAEPIVD